MTRAIEPARKTPSPLNVVGNKIFVGGIPLPVTESEFLDYFAHFGKITAHIFPLSKENVKMNRGYGFVIYASQSATCEVLSFRKNHVLRAKAVR